MRRIEKKDVFPAVAISLSLYFFLLIYAPLTIYFNNKGEFQFDVYNILQSMVPLFAMASIASSLVLLLILALNNKAFPVCLGILCAAFVALYIQGEFFSNYIPLLNGADIDWSKYPLQRLISILIWTISFLGFGVLVYLKKEKAKKIVTNIGAISLAFLILSVSFTGIITGGFKNKRDVACSDSDILMMSQNKNLVILLLDMLDADLFSQSLEEHPEYSKIFEDFTYYDNVVCGYPMTMRAIPLFLSGDWHENDEPYETYCKNVFEKAQLFEELKSDSCKMGFYSPDFIEYNSDSGLFDNVSTVERIEHPADFVKMQLMLAGLKTFPHDLKRYCNLTSENILWDSKMTLTNGSEYYLYSNQFVYNDLRNKNVEIVKENCFRFIYTYGAHEPFITNGSIEEIENGTYNDAIASSMTITKTYLEKLKEAGVYDNTAIVVMADHGYNGEEMVGRQNPVLFIKGIEEKHEMCTSSIPISHVDMPEAFINLYEGKTENEVFILDEIGQRNRRFLSYYGSVESELTEYMQIGWAADEETMIPTGVVYPEYKG